LPINLNCNWKKKMEKAGKKRKKFSSANEFYDCSASLPLASTKKGLKGH